MPDAEYIAAIAELLAVYRAAGFDVASRRASEIADARGLAASRDAAASKMLRTFVTVLRDWEPEDDGGAYRRHWEEGWEAVAAARAAGIVEDEP